MRRFAVSILVLEAGAALLLSGMLASTAWAHAAYRDSDPPDEATIAQAPSEIWAEYTEPPTDASYLEVFDPCGRQVDDGNSRADASNNRVYIGLSGSTAGEYRVEWFVDSAVDAHSTRGVFTFTVTDGEECSGAAVGRGGGERERNRPGEPADREGGADDPGATGASAAGSGAGSDIGGRRESGGRADESDPSSERRREPQADAGAQAQPPNNPDTEEEEDRSNIFTGIPLGGLAIALTFAAVIGAVGGFIYAGIMGYHRTGS